MRIGSANSTCEMNSRGAELSGGISEGKAGFEFRFVEG